MACCAKTILRLNILGTKPSCVVRSLAGKASEGKSSSSGGSSSVPNVPGLSTNCLKVANEPVGPGASKTSDYKNPEYFSYNVTSYFEAEVEMLKFRLPQPSNKK